MLTAHPEGKARYGNVILFALVSCLCLCVCTVCMCVFYMYILGAIPQIKRSNADEFIHIFVNNSKKLTEFLEHMVKVCVFCLQGIMSKLFC